MQLKLGWRLLTIFALFTYALLVLAAVWLLAHNFVLAVALGSTIVVLFYAAWLVFTGLGSRKKTGNWLVGIALASLAIELIYFLSDRKNRHALLAFAGLTLLYLALFTVLRKKYWAQIRQSAEQGSDTAHFKRPFLIVNPKSGNGRAMKEKIPDLAKEQGIEVVVTRKGENVGDVAVEAAKAGADVLGISGGDGSIGAVAKVALEYDLPMIVLPGGTRCHFTRDLGLEPKQIADSLAGFIGVERRIDAGEINGRIFLNNASLGLYADIVDHPEYRENKVAVSQQVLSALAQGKKALYDLQFDHDNVSTRRAAQLLVGVNRYSTMNLFELGHRQRLDAGALQIIAVTELNDQIVRRLLREKSKLRLGKSGGIPGLYEWEDSSFEVSSASNTLVVGVDGEREEYSTPVKIRVLPGALRIYVPAEGERGRRKNPLSRAAIRREWQAARRGT